MKTFERDRPMASRPETGALAYVVITYLAALAAASATMTLLCRSISG